MAYMQKNIFLGVTPIDYSLAYVASIWHTSKGTKTAAQDARVTLEAIEVNSKCRNLMNICLTKFNVAS